MSEKKTTVHPIFLTVEQLELVKQLVKPSIEYDEEGEMDIWAEDDNAMNAAQIYRQVEIANKVELQVAWLSVYDVHRAYGGEEEGGWGYDHWTLRVTEVHDSIEELVRNFNEQVCNLAYEVDMDQDIAAHKFISYGCLDSVQHNVETPFTHIKMECFREDTYHSVYLVIEVTPGAEATLHKPIWH